MQFALGFLVCFSLACIIVFVSVKKNLYKKLSDMSAGIDGAAAGIMATNAVIAKLSAPVQNIIHLGIKKDSLKIGEVQPINISVDPSNFEVNSDRLYELLVHNFVDVGGRQKNDVQTWAACITANAGLDKILEYKSAVEVRQALVRLLVNSDDEVTKNFLRTLADSTAATTKLAVVVN